MADRAGLLGHEYLDEVVPMLWPTPAEHVRVGRGPRRTPVSASTREYVVVPAARQPKLLIPRFPKRVAAAAVRNYDTGGSRRKQLRTTLLAAAVRLGLDEVLPDRVRISSPERAVDAGLPAYLSRTLGRPVDVCLYIGPARAVRKPVLQILELDGTTSGFVKVGMDTFTDELVRAETLAVTTLGKRAWSALEVPAVVHSGSWRGHALLAQSAFARASSAATGDGVTARAMDELARSGRVSRTALPQSRYWAALQRRVAALPPSRPAETLAASVADLARRNPDVRIEFGSWHGDWTPWNMTISNGRAQVWDWEKFDDDVPIGFDAAHFATQRRMVLDRMSALDAFRAVLALASDIVGTRTRNRESAALVIWLYAIEIGVRYLEDKESEAGVTRAVQLSSWLDATLSSAAALVSP